MIINQYNQNNNNGLEMVLLWENVSPMSDFAAQTISLDLSAYSHIVIYSVPCVSGSELDNYMDYRLCPSNMLLVNTEIPTFYSCAFMGNDKRSGAAGRNVTIGNSAIEFGQGWMLHATKDRIMSNKYMVPYCIYGIKGVQSA